MAAALGIGAIGASLFGGLAAHKASKNQEARYNEMAELNKQIGQFNAEVAERTGTQSTYAVVEQTKKLLGEQINMMSTRGISLEGSPMFVLGETITMGKRQAQEAYFNAQVNKINQEYAAKGATATALNQAQVAHYNSLSSVMDTVKNAYNGYNLLQSMFKSSTINSNPTFGGGTPLSSNSTIGKLVGTFFV